MTENTNSDALLTDPLAEVTRKERRMLLGVSMIGITLVKMELVPTKISALGIEFAETNQKALLSVLALAVIYFIVAFILYAASDFLAWQKLVRSTLIDKVLGHENNAMHQPALLERERDVLMKYGTRGNYLFILTKPVAIARAIFEFLLPIVVGIYSAFLLLTANINIT